MDAIEKDKDEKGAAATAAQTAELAQYLGMSEKETFDMAGELGQNPDIEQLLMDALINKGGV